MSKLHKRIILSATLLFSLLIFFFSSQIAFAAEKVLILDSTVDDGINSIEAQEAKALGFDVEIVNDEDWAAKTTEDFASYRAIIFGDYTGGELPNVAAAEANKYVWGNALTGNVVIHGSDPAWHIYHKSQQQARKLITNGIAFATSEDGKTSFTPLATSLIFSLKLLLPLS